MRKFAWIDQFILISVLLCALILRAPHEAQAQHNFPVVPDSWEGWCWSHYPCQAASHVVLGGSPVPVLDKITGPLLTPERAAVLWWAYYGLAREGYKVATGGWRGEQLGAADPWIDLAQKTLGSWFGYKVAKMLHADEEKQSPIVAVGARGFAVSIKIDGK